MLITFEGIDGCGKTTQLELLEKVLLEQNIEVVVTKQPGGTEIGMEIRKLLMDVKNTALVPEAELLLYMADRIQHIREIIQPALQEGKVVLCDRYHDSTIAYQGGGRKLDLSWLEEIRKKWVIEPDYTLWFDITPEIARERMEKRYAEGHEEGKTRIENEKLTFFSEVRNEYNRLWKQNPKRMERIDSSQDIATIHKGILTLLQSRSILT